jgi:hypothetical protein
VLLRRSLIAAVCFALSAPASAAAATRYVSASGSDADACTAAAPCGSRDRAYAVAAGGDRVSIAAGRYGAQEVPAGTKPVTFEAAAGTTVPELDNRASNVTFDGIEVDGGFAQSTGFENHGADNVTFRDAAIGNVTDEKGALVSGRDFTFDNVVFHDVRVTDPLVHNECVYAIVVPGFTVRNSSFQECATMDLFFTYGHWWTPLPPAYGDVTLENNVFAHSTNIGPASWHYFSVYVADTASEGGTLAGWVVRNNTFEIPVAVDAATGSGSRWVGNLGSWDCVGGVVYRHNVGQRCSALDRSLNPSSSSATRVAAFGWRDPAHFDFRLAPGSPALGAADPADAPARDRDGNLRDSAPDAGAYELGGTSGPGPATTPPPPPSSSDAPRGGDVPAQATAVTPTRTRLVGAWGFEEARGATVRDASGLRNHGRISGARRTRGGRFGRALRFDGAGDHVTVPDAPSLDLAKRMTLEAWVRPTTARAAREVIFKENVEAGHEAYSLYAAIGSRRAAAEIATGPRYTTLLSSKRIATKRWTHLAATYDGRRVRLYRNGVQVGSRPHAGSLVATADPLMLGGSGVWDEWFKGRIDEVRIFDGVRSRKQIRRDMRTPVSAAVIKRLARARQAARRKGRRM